MHIYADHFLQDIYKYLERFSHIILLYNGVSEQVLGGISVFPMMNFDARNIC